MESLCIYGLVSSRTRMALIAEIALAGSNWFPGPTGAVSGIGVAVEITSPWTL